MSCNGCRVLRKGCSDNCILRPCLQWLDSPESQGHATLFLAKFFGRAALTSFISNVPLAHRPALFQSLLFEACGRTVNPVNGAVGLLGTGNWQLCQAAVDTVLRGGTLRPISTDQGRGVLLDTDTDEEATCSNMRSSSSPTSIPLANKKMNFKRSAGTAVCEAVGLDLSLSPSFEKRVEKRRRAGSASEESGTSSDELEQHVVVGRSNQVKLLELF